ncbi:hypothetical protein RBSH_05815 [Rhodopirellula baltica SH28]|uniref:Uncharacterized protein n=2 Tax=Rhodopirellula baltica TaxID=265606 RepID=K5D8K0_RHOBT|nr:hypothetical protein [Rhodopirellula baltica]EKJ98757.1 hypothetical protein RBSH_05815 [Rhodopirellula baltica SH28]ELP31358.1 hypothetical protein RBSWK_04823 [Rhodopirellula baltica SWK14]
MNDELDARESQIEHGPQELLGTLKRGFRFRNLSTRAQLSPK